MNPGIDNLVEKLNNYGKKATTVAALGLVGLLSGCIGPSSKEQIKVQYRNIPIEEFARAPKDFAEEHVTFLGKPVNMKADSHWDDDIERYGASIDLTLLLPNGERTHCYFFEETIYLESGFNIDGYKNFLKIIGRLDDRIDEGANLRVGGMVNGIGDMELAWVDFGSGREYLAEKEIEATVLSGYCSDVDIAKRHEKSVLYVLSIRGKVDKTPRFMVYFPRTKSNRSYSRFKGKQVEIRAEEQRPLLYKGLSIKETK